MWKSINYEQGEKVGNSIYLKELSPSYHLIDNKYKIKIRKALFQCFCGKEFEGDVNQVKGGGTCGCGNDIRREKLMLRIKKHNLAHHPIYQVWLSMMRRCNSIKCKSYHNYGGRGIKVCDRWNDVSNFIDDMYPTYIKGLDIDRINNDGNYESSNCRWITRKQNLNNTRHNRIIEFNGVQKTATEWSEFIDIPYQTLLDRLKTWSVEKSLTTPLDLSLSHKKINSYKCI